MDVVEVLLDKGAASTHPSLIHTDLNSDID